MEVRAPMPLYEYSGQTCGDRFEKLIRGNTNGARIVCPSCASAAIKRVFSTFATSGGGSEHFTPACGSVG
jgi:putative FmdB family regulatory protein